MKKWISAGIVILSLMAERPDALAQIDSLINRLNFPMEDTSKINLLNSIAEDFLYLDSDKIYDYADKALKLSLKTNNKRGEAQAYNNLGTFYRTKGIYDQSIDYYFKSLKIMEELDDLKGIARSFNLIGILYYYLENYELSLDYYLKALNINQLQNDKNWIAGNSNNVGMIYEIKGDYNKSLEYYLKSLEMNLELNNKNWIGNNYGNIGSVYLRMKNPLSLDYFLKRLKIVTEQEDKNGIATTNYQIGRYYLTNNEFEKAIPFLHLSYELLNQTGNLSDFSHATEALSIAYAGINKHKDAFLFHTEFQKYSDSLNLLDNSKKITRIQLQYQNQKDIQLKLLKNQKSNLVNILIAIGLITSILFFIHIYNRQRAKVKSQQLLQTSIQIENQRLEDEIKYKDKILQDSIQYLMQKNEIITSVSENLNKIKPHFSEQNQEILKKVIAEVNPNIDLDVWKEFEIRFNQVQHDFYSKLSSKFPDLSANEKRLCAFLKLNISTREISALTGQSQKSIDIARNRLRKKLNLTNVNMTLNDFFAKL